MFVDCRGMSSSFNLFEILLQGRGETFSFEIFIYGMKCRAKKKKRLYLRSVLSGSGKLDIWLTRRNRSQNQASEESVLVLDGPKKTGLKVEHAFVKIIAKHVELQSCADCPGNLGTTWSLICELVFLRYANLGCSQALTALFLFLLCISKGVLNSKTSHLLPSPLDTLFSPTEIQMLDQRDPLISSCAV